MDLWSKEIPTHYKPVNDALITGWIQHNSQPPHRVYIKLRCTKKPSNWRNTEINTKNVHLRINKIKNNNKCITQSSNRRRVNPSTKPYSTSSRIKNLLRTSIFHNSPTVTGMKRSICTGFPQWSPDGCLCLCVFVCTWCDEYCRYWSSFHSSSL